VQGEAWRRSGGGDRRGGDWRRCVAAGVGPGERGLGGGVRVSRRSGAYIAADPRSAGRPGRPAGPCWAGPFLDITAIFPVGYISRVLIVSRYFSCRVRVNTTCRF
jgi:hypothetical protein